jgi:hypothetical protein
MNIEVNECPICINELVKTTNYTITQCGHEFHSSCLIQSCRQKNSCPICRKNLFDPIVVIDLTIPDEDEDGPFLPPILLPQHLPQQPEPLDDIDDDESFYADMPQLIPNTPLPQAPQQLPPQQLPPQPLPPQQPIETFILYDFYDAGTIPDYYNLPDLIRNNNLLQ